MTMIRLARRLLIGAAIFAPSMALAQPPGPPGDGPRHRPGDRPRVPPLAAALDANHDGELSSEEIRNASEALERLDRNHDGKLDRSEIMPRFEGPPPRDRGPRREGDAGPRGEGRPPGDRGRGRGPEGRRPRERDGGFRPEGPPEGRRAARGGVPILPPFVRDELSLSEKQQDEIGELERDVRSRLEKILSPDQMHELHQAFRRGPEGRGPGGPGGPGGPEGPRGRRFGGPRDGEGPPVRPERP